MLHKGEFPLKGYFVKQPIILEYEGQEIQLGTNENVTKLEKLRNEEDTALETGVLQIQAKNGKEEKLALAIDIKNLLSIALGRRIIFDRQKYWTGNTLEVEEKAMSKGLNQGDQIVPDFQIAKFLQSTLPFWTEYSEREKDDIFRITDYLNQTKCDFIEDRIMRTVQAWECAANFWVSETELSAELKDLRDRIKNTFKQWKNETQYVDTDGELGKRLTGPLDQEKLMLRLNYLIKECGLNSDKIGLNIKRLKDLRDKVAHTGRINISGTEAINYLMPGVQGLQLILLRHIGYNGLVYGVKDNYKTIEKLNDFFV